MSSPLKSHPVRKSSLNERLSYQFDNFMAKGTGALIGGLGLLSILIIAMIAAVVWFFQVSPGGGEPVGFVEAFWLSLMRTLDAGTMGGDVGWAFRILMFVVTLGGVFIISTLIGVLTSGVDRKLDSLRQGRSRVIEEGHTVILGWSPQIFIIIQELIIANMYNKGKSCIVILGDKDKVEMEDEIKERIGKFGKTRIVCRKGTCYDVNDLAIVNLLEAKSIVVLSPESENADAEVIKILLAITNNPNRPKDHRFHIVTEIKNPKMMEVAKMVAKDELEVVVVADLISRIIAQTCRQASLSLVYSKILDYEGDAVYFRRDKTLVGKTFLESLFLFEDSAVIGLKPYGEIPILNPPMEKVIGDDDEIIAITKKFNFKPSGKSFVEIDESVISSKSKKKPKPENILILGWNWRVSKIIEELDNYVVKGSIVKIVSKYDDSFEDIKSDSLKLEHLKVEYEVSDTTDRTVLEGLITNKDDVPLYDHVIVLCYSDHLSAIDADSLTIITLLHIRDISSKIGKNFSVVSEFFDNQNRLLAESTNADDYIVSDKYISLLLAQISENKYLNALFSDIFDEEGSEIYLKSADEYVVLGHEVNFYTVLEAASKKNEIAIGYRINELCEVKNYVNGVVINPKKSSTICFTDKDKIIVVAED